MLARDAVAPNDLPPFHSSGMDGFAVIVSDTNDAPVALKVIGEARAGLLATDPLTHGTAIRVSTGLPVIALVPEDCEVLRAGEPVDTGRRDAVGRRARHVVTAGPTTALGGEPRSFEGHARDRFVYAPVGGVLRTQAAIAQPVAAGETVATIDGEALLAPLGGILRGLVHDGVPVAAGAKVVEVDPRGDLTKVNGMGPRPRRIAEGVLEAIQIGAA